VKIEEGGTDGVSPQVWRVHGRDYDLSDFVDSHPGGALMLLLGKGTDCTMLFESYHIFNEPRKRLAKYDVTPDGLHPPVPDCPSPFMIDVRLMVKEHFKGRARYAHKTSRQQLVLMLFVLLVELAAGWEWWVHASVLSGVVAGAAATLLMIGLMHDASHGALTHYPHRNTLAHFVGCAPWVCGQCSWWLQHVVSHHAHTNEIGLDVDAHGWQGSCGTGVRWHWGLGHFGSGVRNVLWHAVTGLISTIGMSIGHPVGFIFLPLWGLRRQRTTGDPLPPPTLSDTRSTPEDSPTSVTTSIEKTIATKLTNPPPPGAEPPPLIPSPFDRLATRFAASGVVTRQPAVFFGNVFIWILSMTALFAPMIRALADACAQVPVAPSAFVGTVAYGVLLAGAPFFASSLYFMATTQISHIQEGCQSAEALGHACPFERQACTSMDYSTSSRLACFLTGGLNTQSLHHTLPSISLVHYHALYPAFHKLCVKHGCVPEAPPAGTGLLGALAANVVYVYRLGRGDSFGEAAGDTA